jgi:hypothetical protein
LPFHFLILRAPVFPFRRKRQFSARQTAALRRLAAGQRRFRFLDLCIRFGKIISKVCEGFNSGAKKLDTNSNFEVERVRSPSPAIGGAGLRSATAPPSLWREMKRILMLSEGIFSFFKSLCIMKVNPIS